jgi:RNA polymerase sigma-70 factor, ECF subfamily
VADSVGLALMVVLETLGPAERLAFVLHDVFGVPFEEIAPMVDRSPAAARQLASRARRRVRGAAPAPDGGLPAQREVVEAFFAAGRNGDFDGLVAVLDPDVVLRVDVGDTIQGAAAVAGQARMYGDREARHATVNGAAGAVILVGGRPTAVMGFTVVAGRVVAIDVVADPARVRRLDLSFLD